MQKENLNTIVKDALTKGTYTVTGRKLNGKDKERFNVVVKKDGNSYNVIMDGPVGALDKNCIHPLTKEELKKLSFANTVPTTKQTVPLNKHTETKEEKPKFETIEKTTKKYYIGVVIGVRYVFDLEDGSKRDVAIAKVWSDEDLANKLDEQDAAMAEAVDDLHKRGYFIFEADALADATKTAARLLNELAHDIAYGDHGPCPECSRRYILAVEDFLRLARGGYMRHCAKLDEINDPKCHVGVFPDDEELENFKYANGHLHLKNPPTCVEEKKTVKVGILRPEDLPPEARKAIQDFIDSHTKADTPRSDAEGKVEKKKIKFEFVFTNKKLAGRADKLTEKLLPIFKDAEAKQVDFFELSDKDKAILTDLARQATRIKKLTLNPRWVYVEDDGGPNIVKVYVGLTK